MLDIVLIREDIDVYETRVQSTDGIVKIDAYHPPLDIVVMVVAGSEQARMEPGNICSRKDWNFNKADLALLYDSLTKASWHEVLEANDVFTCTDIFLEKIYDIFDKGIPKKRRTKGSSSRRYPVWFTKDIIADIKVKSRMHAKWKRENCEDSHKAFSELRASLKCRVSVAHDAYLEDIERNIVENPRGFWQHVTSLRSKGGFEPSVTYEGETVSGVNAAEAFAKFFVSVYHPEVPKLDVEDICGWGSDRTSSLINISEVTMRDVASGIKSLKATGSAGPDNIPAWFLKMGEKFLAQPLCHILNRALVTGVYPSQWKITRVTPIPKTSKKNLVEEYRPIAILSCPAKVFERVLHREIYRQVDHLLCNEQHGFRKKRSVNTNLLTAVDYISSRLDRRIQVDVMYFDFRKAFDRVNNDVLLAKLGAIGFSPALLRLIADYLRNRQQFVKLGIYESDVYHTRSGVGQGSILGPLLFILMINDIPSVLRHAKCLLYADDLKLISEIKSAEDCLRLQLDVDAVYDWSVANKMEFNPSKCYTMSFTRNQHPICFLYTLGSDIINRCTSVRDLGITFDPKLTFNDHITCLAKETFQRLGFVLRNCRDFKRDSVIKLIYSALVRSKIESSSCVWHPHESSYTLLLEKVQKAFLRFLYKRLFGYYPFLYPTKFLLGCLGYNSLEVRRSNDQIVIMLKALRGNIDAPDLVNCILRLSVPENYLRGRKHRLFAVPFARTAAHAQSPIPRTLASLNAFLDSNPTSDVFADTMISLATNCLKFCENNT